MCDEIFSEKCMSLKDVNKGGWVGGGCGGLVFWGWGYFNSLGVALQFIF